jgi:hypothetical protein
VREEKYLELSYCETPFLFVLQRKLFFLHVQEPQEHADGLSCSTNTRKPIWRITHVNTCSFDVTRQPYVVIATERNREPDHMISSSHVVFLHLVGASANGATQLS